MTRVRLAVALNGGLPLSHTRNGIGRIVPIGRLALMWQFCSPTFANSWPAQVDRTGSHGFATQQQCTKQTANQPPINPKPSENNVTMREHSHILAWHVL